MHQKSQSLCKECPLPARRDAARRTPRRGVSLIELTIVVLILGILASVGGLKYVKALNYQEAQRTAQRIRADLQAARHASRSRSQVVSLAFNTANNSYTVLGLVNPDHPGGVYTVNLNEGNLRATLLTASFGGDATIIFNAFGMPDSGGSISLRSGSTTQTVSVAAQSGEATVP